MLGIVLHESPYWGPPIYGNYHIVDFEISFLRGFRGERLWFSAVPERMVMAHAKILPFEYHLGSPEELPFVCRALCPSSVEIHR